MAAPSGWDFHSAWIDVMMIALQDTMGSKPHWSAWYSSSVLVTFYIHVIFVALGRIKEL
jgi:hypothetical protein